MHLITSIVELSFTTLVYFAQTLQNMLTTVTEYHPGFSSSVALNSNHAKGQLKGIHLEWQYMPNIGLTPLLEMMIEFIADIKSAAFADDLTAVGKCETKNLVEHGPWIQPATSKFMTYSQTLSRNQGKTDI